MKPVTFVRTAPAALGESPDGEAVVCAACGTVRTGENGAAMPGGYHNPLSLDERFVRHPSATYFVQVGAHEDTVIAENHYLGVRTGDVLTIDRSVDPAVGMLVLAVCEGTFALCRYIEHDGERFLVCGTRGAKPRRVGDDVVVWGVVVAMCRRM